MRLFFDRWKVLFALVLFLSCGAFSADAQDRELLEAFRSAHMQSEANRMAERIGFSVDYAPARPLYRPHMDSLRVMVGLPSLKPPEPEQEADPFRITDIKSYSRLERGVFERRFEDVRWTFFGVESLTGTDTLQTREIRSRMQDALGSPTRVVADVAGDEVTADNNIQFEYWVVVNDSIPLQITDPYGPFDRGIVMGGKAEHRSFLMEVREELTGMLFDGYRPVPFVDYFYDATNSQWYRAGFDGESYFETPIRRPTLNPSMRPRL